MVSNGVSEVAADADRGHGEGSGCEEAAEKLKGGRGCLSDENKESLEGDEATKKLVERLAQLGQVILGLRTSHPQTA